MIAQSRPFGQRYAFVVVGVIFLALLIAAGLRSSPAVMMVPLEESFGWRRDVVSLAAAVGTVRPSTRTPRSWHAAGRSP